MAFDHKGDMEALLNMDEWKDLDIEDLPNDILVGDYEFRLVYGDFYDVLSDAYVAIQKDREEEYIQYRKRHPKTPTHQEIMTKWWKDDTGTWIKIVGFDDSDDEKYLEPNGINEYGWHTKEWFAGRESADIPPES